MKILVIDGQGGKIGKAVIEGLIAELPKAHIVAVGTNSVATAAMLKAGAHAGATGENPAVVNSRDSDVIVGPIGIIIANALYGEVTPALATAVSGSGAVKVLIPAAKCKVIVAGTEDLPLARYVADAIAAVSAFSLEVDK